MTDADKLLDSITDIPTLPDVVARINQLVRDPNTSAADINDVISRDMALSAKVLKLVNSPFYGFPRRITSITYAVVILGFRTIRNLAMSVFMMDLFKKGCEGFDAKAFWRYCIGAAVASQTVAKHVEFPHGEDAFMGGLLHDVGLVIMSQYVTDDFAKVLEKRDQLDCLLLEAEEHALDYDHTQLGGKLMERWNLPPHLVEIVRHYPDPARADADNMLVSIVHLGAIFTRALCFGNAGDNRLFAIDEHAWKQSGLTEPKLAEVLDDIGGEMNRAGEFFEML